MTWWAGHMYFLQVGKDGPIKIGWTSGNVWGRVRALQQSSPEQLFWIGARPAKHDDEQAAHKLLANSRKRSEWFFPTQEVLAFVAEQTAGYDTDAYVREHFRFDLIERMRALPGYQRGKVWDAVAPVCGMTTYEFAKWRDGGRTLTADQAAPIEDAIKRLEEQARAA